MSYTPRAVKPLPEIISGKRFEVRESPDANTAYIDLKGRELVVPFANDPHAVFVRAHETGHLRYTPLTGRSAVARHVEDRTFQAVEDLRINAALRANGIATDAPSPSPVIFPVDASTEAVEVARCVAGLHGRAEGADYVTRALAAGHGHAVAVARECIARVGEYERAGKVAPFKLTLELGEYLTNATAAPPPAPEGEASDEGDPAEGEGEGDGTGAGETPEGAEGSAPSETPAEDADAKGDAEHGDPEGEGDEGDADAEGGDAPEGDAEGDASGGEGDAEGDAEGEGGDALTGDEGDEKGDGEGGSDGEGGDATGEDPEGGEGGEGETPPTETETRRNDRMADSFAPEPSDPAGAGGAGGGKLPPITADELREVVDANFYPNLGTNDAGRLVVVTPSLTRALRAPKLAADRSTTDSGSIPSAMHRFATDRRIFRASKPGRDGVAILLDASGSMRLSDRLIDSLLDECPASVIAAYSGFVLGSGKHGEGELIVLANGKRRVPTVTPYHRVERGTGLNVVDRPALEWLAARRERRKIWVCDGIVTGKDDGGLHPRELRRIADIVKHAGIVRVDSIQETVANAADLFNVHRRPKYRAPDRKFREHASRIAGVTL